MQIPSAILTLVIGMVLALGGLWIGQNINLLPIDASANAPIYDELFKVLFTIGSILFIGIVGLLVFSPVSYTHLRAHETEADLVCRLLLEKKK